MMAFGRLTAIVAALAVLVLAACGGEDETAAITGTPVLRSSPIPTAVIEPTPTPVCDPPAQSTLPDNFPQDVSVPPEYKVDAVETTPHLKVVGRASPPSGRVPYAVVFEELQRRMNEQGWTTSRPSATGDGARINFESDDGRGGFFHALPDAACTREVNLIYEFFWITP